MVIHADEVGAEGGAARVEMFTVGGDLEKGERLQWVVEGGKYKASFLEEGGGEGELLIGEVCVLILRLVWKYGLEVGEGRLILLFLDGCSGL